MIQLPEDKATLTQMTDQSFRSNSADRVVDQMIHILDVQGVPDSSVLSTERCCEAFSRLGATCRESQYRWLKRKCERKRPM